MMYNSVRIRPWKKSLCSLSDRADVHVLLVDAMMVDEGVASEGAKIQVFIIFLVNESMRTVIFFR